MELIMQVDAQFAIKNIFLLLFYDSYYARCSTPSFAARGCIYFLKV